MRPLGVQPALRTMLAASLAVHVVGMVGLWAAGVLWTRREPPPQHVLVTKLVRLGTPRPKELLPQKDPTPTPAAPTPLPAAPKAPAPKPTPVAAVPAPVPVQAPTAQQRAAAMGRVSRSLDRLRRQVDGQADGDAAGDTDLAQEGDKWASEVASCFKRNFAVEGLDANRLAHLSVPLQLRVQANGKIVGWTIVNEKGQPASSGYPALDVGVGRAIQRCGKVSPLPEYWRRKVRAQGFVAFRFAPGQA